MCATTGVVHHLSYALLSDDLWEEDNGRAVAIYVSFM